MRFLDFLKEKSLSAGLLFLGVLSIEIFLMIYSIGNWLRIYVALSMVGAYGIGILVEYFTKNRFYQTVTDTLTELKEKYFITEVLPTSDFLEARIFKNWLQEIDKSMYEHVNEYKYLTEDYKEYIELWIHEIKLPIATSKMVIANHKNNVTKSIEEELDKLENYVEQALFYARSNTVEKDYYIRKCKLEELVNESIKKNKNTFMQEKTKMKLHDLDMKVETDSKWIVFILSQILQNSSKYRKSDGDLEIEIFGESGKEKSILVVKDNGIGIENGEVSRVFEKGFTGTNGRMANKKSTGIGLYLCKKLCDKLGIALELNSVKEEGTEVRLVFPMGSLYF